MELQRKKTREGHYEYDEQTGEWRSYGMMGDYLFQIGRYVCVQRSVSGHNSIPRNR